MNSRLGSSGIKLRPHALGNDVVSRTRLLSRLDARRPLTLVEAPAGYGKTTLIIDWLAHGNIPYAWLTLDEYDNSLATFLSYVVSSVRTLFPAACSETLALLDSSSAPPDSVISMTLTEELSSIGTHFVIVLDEYHTIKNLAIHKLMGEVLSYQPLNLEIVLITRHEPPLPLPAMRAHNRVTEIRTRELRFSRDECRSFLELNGGSAFANNQLEELDEVFEGWIAGLRMAVLLLQQEEDGSSASFQVERNSRYAAEYLTQEVISHLSSATRDFLVTTAHAEQVTAPLASAMLDGRMSVQECRETLEELARDNLFVFPVHGEEMWYRYHNLFRRTLMHIAQNEYPPGRMANLYAQASAYLETRGNLDAALAYAVRSGNIQSVANLVRDHRHDMIDHWHWSTIESWRRLIPNTMINAHPQLLVLDGWHYSHRGYIKDLEGILQDLRALMDTMPLPADEQRSLEAEVDVMTAQVTYWTGDGEKTAYWGKRVLDNCCKEHAFNRSYAWLYYVAGLQNMGKRAEVDAALEEATREAASHRGTVFPVHVRTVPCFVYMHRADFVRLDAMANELLALSQNQSHLESSAWGHFFRGVARYFRNDLTGAERDFTTLLDLSYIAHPLAFSQAHSGLAATLQAQGEYAKAYEIAVQGWELFQQSSYSVAAARAEGMTAYLAFRQGRIDQAAQWVSRPLLVPFESSLPFFTSTVMGRVTVLLALDSPESRGEAAELLTRFSKSVEKMHAERFQIEAFALQAVLFEKSGLHESALDLAERSVQMTIPGDAVRTLADLDFLVGSLLDELAKRGRHTNQIHRIRRAAQIFPHGHRYTSLTGDGAQGENAQINGTASETSPAATTPMRTIRSSELIESLTYREMDVLQLLADRPTNKEIARELNISTETVKRHMVNIFQKLNVGNRRQAVSQARTLGILPPKSQ